MALNPGDDAPNFALKGTGDTEVTLSQFKGRKSVLLVFYCADSTPG
ncbi:MAG: redoxin domain-containing protein [Chloroflexi bacterium]|nr:redoxin domain-containing protein [Chloroflexota bacterium]